MTCPVVCAYLSIKEDMPHLRHISKTYGVGSRNYGYIPVKGECPIGTTEMGVYNPKALIGKMSVYAKISPDITRMLEKDIGLFVKSSVLDEGESVSERVPGASGGIGLMTVQKSGLSGRKNVIVETGTSVNRKTSEHEAVIKLFTKEGAEYLDRLLDSLKIIE